MRGSIIFLNIVQQSALSINALASISRGIEAMFKAPGMTALMRGSLVYCFEGADNGDVRSICLDRSQQPFVEEFAPELLGRTVILKTKALCINDCDAYFQHL